MSLTVSSPMPVGSRLTSGFMTKARPDHSGNDYGPPKPGQRGVRYTAAAPGRVIKVGWNLIKGHTGLAVMIDHGEVTGFGSTDHMVTYGGHLRTASVKVGDVVECGDDLGEVGTTGNSQHIHLHFSVLANGKFIDPGAWLGRRGVTVGTTAPRKPARRYTVRRGDTLGAIARRYRTSVARLVSVNRLRNANLIYPGQTIEVR